MSKYLEPLVEIELEILLGRRPNETPSPTAPTPVGHWATDRATRTEEEYVDVRIDLADDGEAHIEVQVERLEGYVGSQTTILPLVAK